MGVDYGVTFISAVISTLEAAGIPSCLVGVSALKYYGARRVSAEWQLCVPTDQHERAAGLLKDDPRYEVQAYHPKQPMLVELYPRFNLADQAVKKSASSIFLLIPSKAVHLEGSCHNDAFEKSLNDLPYIRLPLFAQSLLDVNDMVSLADVVDGMNLDEDWGLANLQLEGDTDTAWTRWANEHLLNEIGKVTSSTFRTRPLGRAALWAKIVDGKQQRASFKYDPKIYATRYRMHGSADPRTRDRSYV